MDEMKNNEFETTTSVEPAAPVTLNQPAAGPVTPTPEKKPNNSVKIIIPIIALVLLVTILLVVAFATGTLGGGSGKKEIAEAIAATFTQSGDALKDVWDFDEYKEMFKDKQMSVSADLVVLDDLDMQVEYNIDDTVSSLYMGAGLYGIDAIEALFYTDEKEFSFSFPDVMDYVFYVDRATLEEDIWNLVDEGIIDEEIAENLIILNQSEQELNGAEGDVEQGGKDILEAVKSIYQKAEVKKIDGKTLEVDGEDVNCKGYAVIVTPKQIAEFFIAYKKVYEENEGFQNYFNQILAMQGGYDSVDELLEYIDPAKELQNLADEASEKIKEDIEICFYLHDGLIARISYEKDRDNYFEWNIKGGNFPLENTNLTLMVDGYEIYAARNGDKRKGLYTANYTLGLDYETLYLDIEYDTGNGDLEVEAYDYYDEIFFNGNLYKSVPGSELEIEIYGVEIDYEEILYGDLVISNECGEIVRPEGDDFNLLEMTEDEYYDILGEIIYSMY